ENVTCTKSVSHDKTDNHRIADLGCSSSKNALLSLSYVLKITIISHHNFKQVGLNYIFENDFNNLFKLLPDFYAKLKEKNGDNFFE
ncbi:hypothetical protein M8C21_011146, partial [Ambrosia artemisiifolia]